jgi:hypothetical protein
MLEFEEKLKEITLFLIGLHSAKAPWNGEFNPEFY